jgi:hypothetical protein
MAPTVSGIGSSSNRVKKFKKAKMLKTTMIVQKAVATVASALSA